MAIKYSRIINCCYAAIFIIPTRSVTAHS